MSEVLSCPALSCLCPLLFSLILFTLTFLHASVSNLNSLVSSWPPRETHFCSNFRPVRAGVTKCSPYICLLCSAFLFFFKCTPAIFALKTYHLELSHVPKNVTILATFTMKMMTHLWCEAHQSESQASAEVNLIVCISVSSETL